MAQLLAGETGFHALVGVTAAGGSGGEPSNLNLPVPGPRPCGTPALCVRFVLKGKVGKEAAGRGGGGSREAQKSAPGREEGGPGKSPSPAPGGRRVSEGGKGQEVGGGWDRGRGTERRRSAAGKARARYQPPNIRAEVTLRAGVFDSPPSSATGRGRYSVCESAWVSPRRDVARSVRKPCPVPLKAPAECRLSSAERSLRPRCGYKRTPADIGGGFGSSAARLRGARLLSGGPL